MPILHQLATKYDFLVISDEPYGLLYYDTEATNNFEKSSPPLRSLMQLACQDEEWMKHCVACGSFSKILAPGLRLGWYHTHPENIPKIMASGVHRGTHTWEKANTFIATKFEEICSTLSIGHLLELQP
mmetsp:Transcript_14498/g.12370  ORF Transcript_14498/g.12370 Transcript_14498/m.12370 type:complete len:128 (+) Transcript_14498:1-384(+)